MLYFGFVCLFYISCNISQLKLHKFLLKYHCGLGFVGLILKGLQKKKSFRKNWSLFSDFLNYTWYYIPLLYWQKYILIQRSLYISFESQFYSLFHFKTGDETVTVLQKYFFSKYCYEAYVWQRDKFSRNREQVNETSKSMEALMCPCAGSEKKIRGIIFQCLVICGLLCGSLIQSHILLATSLKYHLRWTKRQGQQNSSESIRKIRSHQLHQLWKGDQQR